MASSYFDEHNCAPLGEGETPDQLIHLARLLADFGFTDQFSRMFSMMNIKSPPASKDFVKKLTTRLIPEDCEDDKCPVCIKVFEEQEEVKQLPCKHEFHSGCILPWLEKTNTCPVCRHELPTDDETYEEYRRQKKREKDREEDLKTLHNSMFS